MESKYFNIDDSVNVNELFEIISASFSSIIQKPRILKQVFYDSFDWRLFRKDLTLYKAEQTFFLYDINKDQNSDSIISNNKKIPRFWQDFPESSLKEKLNTILEIRALIPVITLEIHEKIIRIINDDEKTVVRVSFNKAFKKDKSSKTVLKNSIQLIPVRGYPKDFENVSRLITNTGLLQSSENLIYSVLETERNKLNNYTGKLNIKLNNQMYAKEACKIIYFDLLSTIRQNEDGIKKDIDSEFLHDFRVAVRRTRSAFISNQRCLSQR